MHGEHGDWTPMDAFRAAIARDPVCVSEGVYKVDQADQPVTARGKGKGRKRGNRAGKSVRQLAHRYPPIPEHGTIAWYRSELRSYQMYCLVLERRAQLAQDEVVQLEQQSLSKHQQQLMQAETFACVVSARQAQLSAAQSTAAVEGDAAAGEELKKLRDEIADLKLKNSRLMGLCESYRDLERDRRLGQ